MALYCSVFSALRGLRDQRSGSGSSYAVWQPTGYWYELGEPGPHVENAIAELIVVL